VPEDGVGLVRPGEHLQLPGVQPQTQGCDGIIEMLEFAGADDRGGNTGLVEDPRQCDMEESPLLGAPGFLSLYLTARRSRRVDLAGVAGQFSGYRPDARPVEECPCTCAVSIG